MTALLEKAFARAASMPPEQQDFVAAIILEGLDGNERWEALLADPRSQTALDRLAAEDPELQQALELLRQRKPELAGSLADVEFELPPHLPLPPAKGW